MTRVVLRRLSIAVPVLFLVSVAATVLAALVPGDTAATLAGPNASPETVSAIRDQLRLNTPLLEQYGRWIMHALHGDLGTSLFSGQSVGAAIVQRLPMTVSLAFGALLFGVVIGGTAGLLSAVRRGGLFDRITDVLTAGAIAVPNYFLGTVLILVFATWTRAFPATSYVPFGDDPLQWAQHLVLPSMALGTATAAVLARQLRASMTTVLQQDYMATAEAKGLRGPSRLLKHALRNAAVPSIAALGSQVPFLLSGTVLVEQVFGIQGIGSLAVTAVLNRDLPVIQGVVVVSAIIVLLSSLITDLLTGYLNPKVRIT